MSDLESVKRSANEFLSQERELHILFNNAGDMIPPVEQVTKDGYDLQFGTNVLGHWYFTKLLIPAVLAGRETSPDKHTRIVTTSSSAAYFGTVDWDTLKDDLAGRKLKPWDLYFQSKFACGSSQYSVSSRSYPEKFQGNAVIAREFAKRYGHEGIVSTSLNPGNLQTDIQRHASLFESVILRHFL